MVEIGVSHHFPGFRSPKHGPQLHPGTKLHSQKCVSVTSIYYANILQAVVGHRDLVVRSRGHVAADFACSPQLAPLKQVVQKGTQA
eukprot:1162136-Pelagomonas_calceolata.AAC.7